MISLRSLQRFLLLAVLCSTSSLLGQTPDPKIAAVMNAASYAEQVLSPGEMVVIFGTDLGPAELVHLALDESGNLRTELSSVRVLFDGIPAPLIYVSRFQVSAMVPYGVLGRGAVSVQVMVGSVVSNSIVKTLAQSAPGIFTIDASGRGQAALTNSDYKFNSREHPAMPGEWFTFYLTGEGPIDPPGVDGRIISGTTRATLPVVVRIAGRVAPLLYAGSAPGNVNGFAQVNAVVPQDLPFGGELPLTIQIGDVVSSEEVTISVAGQPAPKPMPPFNLSGSFPSAGSIAIRWDPADNLATHFLLERAVAASRFTEVARLPAVQTSYTDSNLQPLTSYRYRLRAVNEWGISAYSDTIERVTGSATVQPPTNLSAQPLSQTEVQLTWTNNAPSATGYRIEMRDPGAQFFREIGQVSSSSSTKVIGLYGGTQYAFRVRAVLSQGLSGYSNITAATTRPKTTVFILHGLGQGARDVIPLTNTIRSGLDARRFEVNGDFDFSDCSMGDCSSSCSFALGAQRLANHVANRTIANSDVILVGYSMGGLIAREMIATNNNQIATTRRITRLITLGTPNAGYPWGSFDNLGFLVGQCPVLALDMKGDWRIWQGQGLVDLSPYLTSLFNRWKLATTATHLADWNTISGSFCREPVRTGDVFSLTGCPDNTPNSDGVVCEVSSSYRLVSANTPSHRWVSPLYAHSRRTILCGFSAPAETPLLHSPMNGDQLSQELWRAINAP